MNTLRALLVGAGAMGRNWGANLRDCHETELVAWVDAQPDIATRAAANLGLHDLHIGPDLERAIALARPDFLVDASPPHVHHEVTLCALAAGVPVLGEKPMAESMAHAREMVAAAERAGKLYMVSQNRRFDPNLAELRRLIVDQIGTLGILNADFYMGEHYSGFRTTMPSPLLVDMAIHTFDAARYLSGADPVAVYCHEFNPSWSWYQGDASASAIFEMTDGLCFTYRGSRCSDGWHTTWDGEWRAVGARGTAAWDGRGTPAAHLVEAIHGDFPTLREVPGTPYTGPHQAMVQGIRRTLQAFLHALNTGTTPMCECHDNIKSLAMVHAAIESAATGQRVAIAPLLA